MRAYVRETEKIVNFRIYGIKGTECTREFFRTFFKEVDGVRETTAEEKMMYGNDVLYTIETQEFCDVFIQNIERIQDAIDWVAVSLIEGYSEEEFRFESDYYAL